MNPQVIRNKAANVATPFLLKWCTQLDGNSFEGAETTLPLLEVVRDLSIGGALALGFSAVPRATLDGDVGVDADLPDLLATLRQAGCSVDFGRALEAAQRGDFGVRRDGICVHVFLPAHPDPPRFPYPLIFTQSWAMHHRGSGSTEGS